MDDEKAAEGRVDKTILGRFSADETFDTGEDDGSPVSDVYESRFRFTGTMRKVTTALK